MRGLHSGFPPAPPGIGLLILRVVLASSIAQGAWHALTAFDRVGHDAYLVYGLTLIVLSVPVVMGFLTPVVHVGVALVESAALLVQASSLDLVAILAPSDDPRPFQITIAIALAFLGPGAYSVDGHLFGRHEIVIRPPVTSTPAAASRARK